jgi:signal peptidase
LARKRTKNKVSILGIILLIIFLPIFIINATLIVKSYIHKNEVPDFFGYKPFIVLSGSMEKKIMTNDLIVVKEYDKSTTKVGDIISFKIDNTVITHRIYDIKEIDGVKYYVTKGDNNNIEDREFITDDNIEGIYLFRIPRLGAIAMFMQTTLGAVVCISVPFLLFIIYDIVRHKKQIKLKEEKNRQLEEELRKLKGDSTN